MAFDSHQELREHIYTIGLITLEWNVVDECIANLLDCYVGHEAGPIIRAALGRNRSKSAILASLAETLEENAELKTTLIHSLRVSDTLRENRNILVHSMSVIDRGDGKVEWQRAPQSSTGLIAGSHASLDDLSSIYGEIKQLAGTLSFLFYRKLQDQGHQVFVNGSIGMPGLLPSPRKLKEIDPEVLASLLVQLPPLRQKDR